MKALVTRCMACGRAMPDVPFYLAGRAAVRCRACQREPVIEPGSLKSMPSTESVASRQARARKLAAAKRKAGGT